MPESIILYLQAVNTASLPEFPGRLLHAAFFQLLHACSPQLSAAIHDNMQAKPFSISLLTSPRKKRKQHGRWQFVTGEQFSWRINALTPEVYAAVSTIQASDSFNIGALAVTVVSVSADTPGQNLLPWLNAPEKVREIQFHFHTPVSFRKDKYDYPIPQPALIFASLADKWNSVGMTPVINKEELRILAEQILPRDWQGKTAKVYFAKDRGMLAFTGDFRFALQQLKPEQRTPLLRLAHFACYAGVGRLTTQGFGQTTVDFI